MRADNRPTANNPGQKNPQEARDRRSTPEHKEYEQIETFLW